MLLWHSLFLVAKGDSIHVSVARAKAALFWQTNAAVLWRVARTSLGPLPVSAMLLEQLHRNVAALEHAPEVTLSFPKHKRECKEVD